MLLRSVLAMALFCVTTAVHAQTMAGPYAGPYTLVDLGGVAGLPANYGGVGFLNNNTLLIGGAANTAAGDIYQVPLIRNGAGQITGFSGPAVIYKNAPNIDGGVIYGALYTDACITVPAGPIPPEV